MEETRHLIFTLHGLRYAVDARVVREVLWLPELTPVAEAPHYIVGVFNLRGTIIPVMDCDVWLGRTPQRYSLTDNVIILAHDGLLLGIIVHEIHNVHHISSDQMAAAPAYGQTGETRARFIAGAAQVDEELIMLLHYQNLTRSTTPVEGLPEEHVEADWQATHVTEPRAFCPEASPEDKAIWRERARQYMQPTENRDITELIPLVVVGLNGEYFGVELEVLREFAEIHQVTPVPCCPPHIIGDMNLRGDILTLVDIRRVLQVPSVGGNSTAKAMVVHVNDLLVGVLVDDVFDVMYLRASDMTTVPAALQAEGKAYLKGTAPYGGKMLSILDMPKLLACEDLVVNEDL